jgi:hypothetical protein
MCGLLLHGFSCGTRLFWVTCTGEVVQKSMSEPSICAESGLMDIPALFVQLMLVQVLSTAIGFALL